MIPEELEKLIIRHKKEGHLPFFVNCTTGTTVYGAFDPIEPIADICEKYGIWLHIDVSLILKPFSINYRNWAAHQSVLFTPILEYWGRRGGRGGPIGELVVPLTNNVLTAWRAACYVIKISKNFCTHFSGCLGWWSSH